MNYKVQDQSSWKRKQHYDFYKDFSEPFFGLTVDIDITSLYLKAKERGISIFLAYVHEIMVAMNSVEEFRYRIAGDEVRIYDSIGLSATVARDDETFGFSYVDYDPDFERFSHAVKTEFERVKGNSDLIPATDKLNIIHFSSIPWIKFTSLSHARHFEFADSIPKISAGKIFPADEKYLMPLSVHAHHALLDALQVSRFLERLEHQINDH